MELTIKTRNHGRVVFFTGNGTSYVYINLNGKFGTMGNQICSAGRLAGNTISYSGESYEEFERACRKWWRSYLRLR